MARNTLQIIDTQTPAFRQCLKVTAGKNKLSSDVMSGAKCTARFQNPHSTAKAVMMTLHRPDLTMLFF